ncbi:macro domain-containing protein [Ligilactobacillus equi]
MIIYTNENLFNSPAQTLVNTVNVVGVMGKGIAKDFKGYYPQMYKKYRKYCDEKSFKTGQLMLSKEEPILRRGKDTGLMRQRWVLNFPTKRHWRSASKIEYVEDGLKKFVETYEEKGIKSISFPQLGVGNGRLPWSKVRSLMEEYLGDLSIPVYIHIYEKSDYYGEEDKQVLEDNLNSSHISWQSESELVKILKRHGLEDLRENINIDGIVLPSELVPENKKLLEVLKKNTEYTEMAVLDSDSDDKYMALRIKKINLLGVENEGIVQTSLDI